MTKRSDVFVAEYVSGDGGEKLPVWAGGFSELPAFDFERKANVLRKDMKWVPATWQLFNVLSAAECASLIRFSLKLGYHLDAAITLSREIRHNANVVWIADEQLVKCLWRRIESAINQNLQAYAGARAVSINPKWRFYRYQPGDFFKFHKDGSNYCSRLVGKELHRNETTGLSQMTLLLLLNDDYEGGATRFVVNADDQSVPPRYYNRTKYIDVRTPKGAALCFPHGDHPMQCSHSGEVVTEGHKFVIRTDVYFQR